VYYAGPAGQLTSFMDRLFYASGGRMAYKPAAAVVSCRRGGSTASLDRLNKYFTISNMPVVPSQYWNQVHGNTPDEVKQDLEGMQIMRTLGRNMGWMMKCIEAGKKAGISVPAPEERTRTNFIR
jgi:multimeric flavodoxin WrbA